MPILAWIFLWSMVLVIVLLFYRGLSDARTLSEKNNQIKMLSSLLQASLPGGLVQYIETEIKSADAEISSTEKKADLGHALFFKGYRSALRNILIAIRGWI